MRFNSLHQWLEWQESLNPKEIDLGLDRVKQVLDKLNIHFTCPVITVAGTNGKGSTVAFLESILNAADYSVGCYTSPHLFEYNERIRINKKNINDQVLCSAFEKVDQARGDIPLTYFEFGTLAAFCVFSDHQLDAVVLEIGLGGRLDAVNVVDPDVSIISSVDIDHTDWLGSDIESIAKEKAGIMRPDKPVIYGSLKRPASIDDVAKETQANLIALGQDYLYQCIGDDQWQLTGLNRYDNLPMPTMKGAYQIQNAAAAIMALNQLSDRLPVDAAQIKQGLQQASITGRYQCLQTAPEIIVDVAHNTQAASVLCELLNQQTVEGNTYAVIAMLADKAVDEVVKIFASNIDEWFTAGLDVPRGLASGLMAKAVKENLANAKLSAHETVEEACEHAVKKAQPNDRVIIFGSFYTVSQATQYINGLTFG